MLKATAKVIEIFQSSDGESIPFGNNWVHKIEENLNKAKIMFVFISPQSVNSNWIYFESGFAYAKEVKVIPIGIKGIDVGKLAPPISLLQGFNISNADGLNNIITVLNREFQTEYEKCFKQEDYLELALHDENASSTSLMPIDTIRFLFPERIQLDEKTSIAIIDDSAAAVSDCFDYLKIPCGWVSEGTLHSHGIVINCVKEDKPRKSGSAVILRMDSYRFLTCKDIIEGLCSALYGHEVLNYFWCTVYFNEDIKIETIPYKYSSKLHQAGLSMSSKSPGLYEYKSLNFKPIHGSTSLFGDGEKKDHLHVSFKADALQPEQIIDLVSELIKAKVISKNPT